MMPKEPFFQFNSEVSSIPILKLSESGDFCRVGSIRGDRVGEEVVFDLTLKNCQDICNSSGYIPVFAEGSEDPVGSVIAMKVEGDKVVASMRIDLDQNTEDEPCF